MKTLSFLPAILIIFAGHAGHSQAKPVPDTSCACCAEAYRAFDFWVGEWEVTGPDGTQAGSNRIEKIQDGCALQENWTGASGSTGTSLNFYNAARDRWEQVWMSSTGNLLKLYGNRREDQMILSSEPFRDAQGNSRVHRITWTARADGTVRQHWEVLQEGEVVQTLFDGIYRRKE